MEKNNRSGYFSRTFRKIRESKNHVSTRPLFVTLSRYKSLQNRKWTSKRYIEEGLKRKRGSRFVRLALIRLIFSTRNPNYYQMQSNIPRTYRRFKEVQREKFFAKTLRIFSYLRGGPYLVKKSVERITI